MLLSRHLLGSGAYLAALRAPHSVYELIEDHFLDPDHMCNFFWRDVARCLAHQTRIAPCHVKSVQHLCDHVAESSRCPAMSHNNSQSREATQHSSRHVLVALV